MKRIGCRCLRTVVGRKWSIICPLAVAIWLGSVGNSVTYYGRQISATFKEGFLGLYWGQDADTRNCRLHNNFVPPWNSTGAGGILSDGTTWEVYGPNVALSASSLCYDLESGVIAQRALGLRWPALQFASGNDVGAFIIPLWTLVAISLILALLPFRRTGRYPQGGCLACGYNLTGNMSGICPECGRPCTAIAEQTPSGP